MEATAGWNKQTGMKGAEDEKREKTLARSREGTAEDIEEGAAEKEEGSSRWKRKRKGGGAKSEIRRCE